VWYYLYAQAHEWTDDAFIEGHIIQVSSRVPGRVLKVHVRDNQDVKAGDLLVEIDPRDFQVRLAQAQAGLEAAEAQKKTAETNVALVRTVTGAGVDQAQAGLEAAEAQMKTAETNVALVRTVTGAGVDQAKAGLAEAEAGASMARAQVAVARSKQAQAEAALAGARATAERARATTVAAEADANRTASDLKRYTDLLAAAV
jgi:membrane fusion protein (multidrug efflux system)